MCEYRLCGAPLQCDSMRSPFSSARGRPKAPPPRHTQQSAMLTPLRPPQPAIPKRNTAARLIERPVPARRSAATRQGIKSTNTPARNLERAHVRRPSSCCWPSGSHQSRRPRSSLRSAPPRAHVRCANMVKQRSDAVAWSAVLVTLRHLSASSQFAFDQAVLVRGAFSRYAQFPASLGLRFMLRRQYPGALLNSRGLQARKDGGVRRHQDKQAPASAAVD